MARVVIYGLLTKEQIEKGYRAINANGHFVELWLRDHLIRSFPMARAYAWAIRAVADNHWPSR